VKLDTHTLKNVFEWKWMRRATFFTISKGGLLGTSEMIMIAASLITTYAFTNWSSPKTYGTYKFFMAIIGTLSIFSLPGVNTAVTTAVASGKKGILVPLIWLRARYAIIASLIAIAVGIYYAFSNQRELSLALLICGIILPFYMSFDTLFAFLLGKSDFKEILIIRSICVIIPMVGVLTLIRVNPDSPSWIIIGYVSLTAILYGICTYWELKRFKEITIVADYAVVARYGKQLTLRGGIGILENRIDLLLVGSFFSLEQLAVFSVGRLAKDLLSKIQKVFTNLLLPKLSEREHISFALTARLLVILFGVFVLVVGILILSFPYVIPLVFTNTYHESILYAQAFAGLTVIGVIGGVLETQFTSKRLIKELYVIRIGTALAYTLALCLFIPLFGLFGILGAMYLRALTYSGICLILWLKEARIAHQH